MTQEIVAAPAEPPPHSGPQSPVQALERVQILDVLRGIAILGILLVNLQFFFTPLHLASSGAEIWPAPVDQIVKALIIFFAQGKFYALFSLLFGVGLAIQMERAAARGAGIAGFWLRRMFWLLLIGLAHGLLLWYGDILFLYAFLGFPLILFRNCKPRTLLIWAGVLLCIPLLLGVGIAALIQVAPLLSEDAAEAIDEQFAQQQSDALRIADESIEAYRRGSFTEISRARSREWTMIVTFGLLTVGPQIFALFLVGLALGKLRFFHDREGRLPGIRRAIAWWLLAGVVGAGLMTYANVWGSPAVPSVSGALGQVLGAPAMTAFYICGICLLMQRDGWRSWLGRFSFVGRMALSNYLLHTVVFTTLAYSYGFALYGRVSPAVGLVLTFGVYLLQIPLSRWWLSRYRFGPVEWIWRSLTYMSFQPLRRAPAD